ncbi:hypothetical protein E2C01_063532 [Portunus trituberculatus]|uniref:Uncharacterized protein n=1 Tax=Portunus trituberculatus TaxID=210409 RepID=A0A5B7HAP5_PORTR|nr:hypothetical protein [Portunus trituberculatus]
MCPSTEPVKSARSGISSVPFLPIGGWSARGEVRVVWASNRGGRARPGSCEWLIVTRSRYPNTPPALNTSPSHCDAPSHKTSAGR